MEIWKAVVGYEGWYEVSDQGRVRRVKTGRILRPQKDKNGYYQVNLCREGSPHVFMVHRLVLMAFRGLPKPDQEGNHKKGNKADNRLEKLEWVTRSENMLHRFRVLGVQTLKGEVNGRAKLNNKDIPIIRRLLAEGKLTQKAIGEMLGVKQAAISRINSGRAWEHVI